MAAKDSTQGIKFVEVNRFYSFGRTKGRWLTGSAIHMATYALALASYASVV